MLSPLPRRSGWAYHFARSPRRVSLPRKGCRVGLRIVLFEACSAFTRVTACTLALSPIRDTHSEGFSYFVTSIAAPVASGWSVAGWDLHPLESAALSRRTPVADVCYCLRGSAHRILVRFPGMLACDTQNLSCFEMQLSRAFTDGRNKALTGLHSCGQGRWPPHRSLKQH